jgi:membrane protease YdiL (CAAX protease family)
VEPFGSSCVFYSMNPTLPPTRKPYPWRILAILAPLIFLSIAAVTPYSLTLQGAALQNAKLPMPLWLLLPLQWLGNTLVYTLLAAAGLFFANHIGLGLPLLESWLAKKPDWPLLRRFALPAIGLGLLAGALVIVLDLLVFGPALNREMGGSGVIQALSSTASRLNPPAWQGFLASFYGGITEEILMRLFVLSLLAWLLRFVNRGANGRPGLAALWIANIIAAVLFGLGHLPATAAAGLPIDALVITRAIVLNGLIGLICGVFYWKSGLESAMLTHFSADIILHVITPLVLALA